MVRWYGQLRRGGMINLRQLRLLVFFGAGLAPAPGFFSAGSGSKEPKTPIARGK